MYISQQFFIQVLVGRMDIFRNNPDDVDKNVIKYICFNNQFERDYIHIVQFVQAFQHVQEDQHGLPLAQS